VSISSKFYLYVFHLKVLFSSYVLAKKALSYEKRLRKMLIKLAVSLLVKKWLDGEAKAKISGVPLEISHVPQVENHWSINVRSLIIGYLELRTWSWNNRSSCTPLSRTRSSWAQSYQRFSRMKTFPPKFLHT